MATQAADLYHINALLATVAKSAPCKKHVLRDACTSTRNMVLLLACADAIVLAVAHPRPSVCSKQ